MNSKTPPTTGMTRPWTTPRFCELMRMLPNCCNDFGSALRGDVEAGHIAQRQHVFCGAAATAPQKRERDSEGENRDPISLVDRLGAPHGEAARVDLRILGGEWGRDEQILRAASRGVACQRGVCPESNGPKMKTILRVFAYVRRYPWMARGTLACAVVTTLMVTVFPKVTQLVIDDVRAGSRRSPADARSSRSSLFSCAIFSMRCASC